jgi:hypothetical protein
VNRTNSSEQEISMSRVEYSRPLVLPILGLVLALSAGCDGGGTPQPAPPPSSADAAADALPQDLLVDAAPAGAVAVATAKRSAQPGEEITVRGRVGGRKEPVIDGRASFLLADPDKISACDTRDDDECDTPWDFCCEPKEKITANTLTIQAADAAGRALKSDIAAAGIEPGAFVVVRGTVGPRPDPNALVISATSIFVER